MKFITLLLSGILISAFSFAQPSLGQQAPEIALPGVDGKIVKLSDLKGKLVLIDFWASWCGPCRKSNPKLVRLYDKYKNLGFEIFGVSIDESKADWKKAINKDKLQWKQVINNKGWEGSVPQIWKIEQIPTSYLIDKSGNIIAIDLPVNELENKIADLLKT